MTDNRMIVYTRDGCQRCQHTIRLATALGMEPRVINTSEDQNAADFLIGLGYQELPVVMIYPASLDEPTDTVDVVEALDAWSGNRPIKIKEWS